MFIFWTFQHKTYNLNGRVDLPEIQNPLPPEEEGILCTKCKRRFATYRIVYINGIKHKYCGFWPDCDQEF